MYTGRGRGVFKSLLEHAWVSCYVLFLFVCHFTFPQNDRSILSQVEVQCRFPRADLLVGNQPLEPAPAAFADCTGVSGTART